MYPIYVGKLGNGEGFSVDEFARNFKKICATHQMEGRASSFAFILHDFHNPEITKVLRDKDYFDSLDKLSGFNLTVFYLHLNPSKNQKVRFLNEERQVKDLTEEMNDFLVETFGLSEKIELPAILFFQIKNKQIVDYFFSYLQERTMEQSFLEIQKLIKEVVHITENISPENKMNYAEIFSLIKDKITDIETIETTKIGAKHIYSFGKIIIFVEKIVSYFV